jgi:hypothetical protein
MTLTAIAVTIAGLALIGFLAWFFFGARPVKTARVTGSGQGMTSGKMEKVDFTIAGGVTCASCVASIEKGLGSLPRRV